MFFSGCDSGLIWEDDQYAVVWIDTGDDSFLYRKWNGVNPVIYRAGPNITNISSNQLYIVFSVGKNEGCNYYVLDKYNDDDLKEPDEVVSGPTCDLPKLLAEAGFPEGHELERVSAFTLWPFGNR
jgi:hypothetical protein